MNYEQRQSNTHPLNLFYKRIFRNLRLNIFNSCVYFQSHSIIYNYQCNENECAVSFHEMYNIRKYFKFLFLVSNLFLSF